MRPAAWRWLMGACHAAAPAPIVTGKTVELAVNDDHARDVAEWGRTGAASPVDLSASDDEAAGGQAAASLSSGLSARDEQWGQDGRGGPRARPFGPAAGLASLVHHTKTYMASQALRKYAVVVAAHALCSKACPMPPHPQSVLHCWRLLISS